MRRRGILLLVVLLAVAAGGTYAESSSASTCVNLQVTKKIRKALKKAHKRLTSRPFTGPQHGSVYYGRCGKTHYALASFKDKDLSYTDQPERFRRRAHHRWADKGDTGGDACGGPTPVRLLHLWGFTSCM